MHVLRNIGELATCEAAGGQGEIHTISHAALVWNDHSIEWVGREADLPQHYRTHLSFDAGGGLVIPGLVDCHTHLGFGGWRADEFAQRIDGRSYLEIAKAGGGILSTMTQTRAMPEPELLARCRGFLREMIQLGVTTVECKSGYGLDRPNELKLLRVYRSLRSDGLVDIVPTFLGAHVVPPEYRDQREGYIRLLVDDLLPAIAAEKLAEFCDVFVEESAFSHAESRRIFARAREQGLGVKLHADQLTSGGGAELAAEVGATSADHLERISQRGIDRMAEAGVVAVSLPLATLYLDHEPLPARALIDAGVAVAIATDFNPGSAPSYHLPLAMMLGCTLQRMRPAEVLKGATLYAARAIGRERVAGSLEPGKRADFAIIDAPNVTQWMYHFQPNACRMTVARGKVRWSREEPPS
ncbi:MAG: imidazolonepropionase [Gemmatimonadota bacterium]